MEGKLNNISTFYKIATIHQDKLIFLIKEVQARCPL